MTWNRTKTASVHKKQHFEPKTGNRACLVLIYLDIQ